MKAALAVVVFSMFVLIFSGNIVYASITPDQVITGADNKAKREIMDNLGKELENKFDKTEFLILKKENSSSFIVIYNKSEVNTPPPPPPPACPPGTHLENGVCVKDPVIPPPPIANTTKWVFTGDVESSSVRDAIKNKNPNKVFVAGDLGYGSSLSWFKSNYGNTFGDKLQCVIGNHEAANEDGSSSLESEAKAFCGNSWLFKDAKTVVIGFNTNGDLDAQLSSLGSKLTTTYMQGVKNVVLLSHKPCATNPNSHHNVESEVKAFCDSLKTKIPAGVNVYQTAGHNHVMSQTKDAKTFISGAGGRSHYDCGTSTTWIFCNNSVYGFLMFTINKDTGQITSHFYNTNGGQIF